jgi:Protein of unknown function (DUF3829)
MKTVTFLALLLTAFLAALASAEEAQAQSLTDKLQPYIECFNSLSESGLRSKARYLSWAATSGPTGKERNIYGTYTLSDPSKCDAEIEAANKSEPRETTLENAGSAFIKSLVALEPLLKQANDYYDQGDYKDDKMAKGKALHPQLMAAWATFETANDQLDGVLDSLNDEVQLERLAEIEKAEGKQAHYYVLAVMLEAKKVFRVEGEEKIPDLAKINTALGALETSVSELDAFASGADRKVGSIFMSQVKGYLTTAKELMRRMRDKTPYSSGDRMMLQTSGAGWMVVGSPPRLVHDYNGLVEAFNRGPGI